MHLYWGMSESECNKMMGKSTSVLNVNYLTDASVCPCPIWLSWPTFPQLDNAKVCLDMAFCYTQRCMMILIEVCKAVSSYLNKSVDWLLATTCSSHCHVKCWLIMKIWDSKKSESLTGKEALNLKKFVPLAWSSVTKYTCLPGRDIMHI